MKQIIKNIIATALFLSSVASARVVPYISIRSQSEDAARDLVIWQKLINRCNFEKAFATFAVTPGYSRSFRPQDLSRLLFCEALNNDCCQPRISAVRVQGSAVAGGVTNALMADYFGLPTDYNSYFILQPRIENFLVDINLYCGFCRDFYFRIHAPAVHTRWDLRYCEIIAPAPFTTGTANYPAGYFNGEFSGSTPKVVPRSNLVNTFDGFIAHRETPLIEGVIVQPLEHARFSSLKLVETALSEIQAAIGCNLWNEADYHVGINLRAAAPTGTRPRACWLFEPVVGNGKHWELGAGFSTHWCAWHSKDELDEFCIYLDANFTHLFNARQCRTFDLIGKPLSRYMLAQQMTASPTNLVDGNGNAPTFQFANVFSPVANLTTIPVDVNASLQTDIALKFSYTHKGFQFDAGYNFWYRSCESITPRLDCCARENSTWALKGDAFVYGFTIGAGSPQVAIPLSASEQDASVFCGTNNPLRRVSNNFFWERNPGVDNPSLAYTNGAVPLSSNITTWRTVYSSFNPIVFSTDETTHLDIASAESRGISHKLFTAIGYIWKEHACWTPFMGVDVEVEFGQHGNRCCASTCSCTTKSPTDTTAAQTCSDCNSTPSSNQCCKRCTDCGCTDCAISQWAVWIKGGFSYN